MKRLPDLARLAGLVNRLEHRATARRLAACAARERHDALVAQRDRLLVEAQRTYDTLGELYQTRRAVNRTKLLAFLETAAVVRLQWRDAIARADLLAADIERAASDLEACQGVARATRLRVDRLERWLDLSRRRQAAAASRKILDLIEEDAWKQCLV
ncbi:MAG TPA: hypothetical protein VL424_05865 [Pararobbsia sp.]|nr:hypothetical protein [Pararobbsia sp.]